MKNALIMSAIAATATFGLGLQPAEARGPAPLNPPVLYAPIGGVENDFWFDYQTDIAEAEHELKKDLARATDDEDVADAREEYRVELTDAYDDYAKEMAERGIVEGRVTVGQK